MIVISIILSYFFTMTILLRKNAMHQRNKLYQALLMGAWMGLIMILLMFYAQKKIMKEYLIIAVVLVVVIIVLSYLIRYQKTIDQDQFMLGMIEHHQMAIDMANLVKHKVTEEKLKVIVSDIITSQNKEISEMKGILHKRRVRNNVFANFR